MTICGRGQPSSPGCKGRKVEAELARSRVATIRLKRRGDRRGDRAQHPPGVFPAASPIVPTKHFEDATNRSREPEEWFPAGPLGQSVRVQAQLYVEPYGIDVSQGRGLGVNYCLVGLVGWAGASD